MTALAHPALGRSMSAVVAPDLRPATPAGYQSFAELFSRWLVFLDPPDHTRLRRLVQLAFTPQVVRTLQAKLDGLAADLVARLEDGADLVASLALPFPLTVICELLGVFADICPKSEVALCALGCSATLFVTVHALSSSRCARTDESARTV